MPKEYWTEVLKFENSFESQERYKHLEELYRDLWKNRSMVEEIDLTPNSKAYVESLTFSQGSKLPRIYTGRSNRRRVTSIEQPRLLNRVNLQGRRNSVDLNYPKRSSVTLDYQNKPLEKQSLAFKSRR